MKTEASKQHEHDDVPHSTVLVIYHINTASTVSTLGLALHFDITLIVYYDFSTAFGYLYWTALS